MSKRSEIHFIKPCRNPEEDHRVLTPQHAMEMLKQRKIVQINLDNCSLQRMEELPANPTLAEAEAVGLLPLVEILQSAPVALTPMGIHEMPDRYVENARRAYESFCATFWPTHKDDADATYRTIDENSTDRWVDFTKLSDGARCTYGGAYVALLQMQNIQKTYPSFAPEKKFELYIHSMISMLDLISAFELEIAKYAFWSTSDININRLPKRIITRRADIKENFTKLKSTSSKCKRSAFNGAMDIYWLSGANLSEYFGAKIKTSVGELTLDNWVGTNDVKLFRICEDLHSVPHNDSKTMRFSTTREPELTALPYWQNVDRLSRDVMLYRYENGYQSLEDTLLPRIDLAVKHLHEELHSAMGS
ncbi:TPA: hypothetical protein L3996_002513 [Pseudomonas aeruginosa]|uniref:hypothetical protein n=1 Tax=Pseudomonas aeruginosa TaxID=287 RepID=UPI000B48A370|nr:hypothetical protein [Pseudomonas aeruginosa]EKU7417940.1 hypothetical protein [Pseudomonas aeruginosa]MBF2891742.1 hypothetical protein [Pseudomonas aeruginosa]MBF2923852.1 hypothetical protein [Pseudomonas aeruginosa]MBF2938408.1 hypothetical protein [Pseudomonas aeruginosa]MBG5021186.1 hypothetical protein [Pseudomonas aeruginosa]